MKIKHIITLTVLTLLGWLGITNTIKLSQAYTAQRQALRQAPTLVTETEKQAANVGELKLRQQKMQETIASLAAIPNLPGLDYNNAQAHLSTLRSSVSRLTQQIQVEEQAASDFNAAQPLAAEAQKLVENTPCPADVWQQAKDKWQQSITLLEKIPEGTFVSAQAKEGLTVTRQNYGVIKQNLAIETEAVQTFDLAMLAANGAARLTESKPYKLVDMMNAQAQWLRAVKLLSQIASSTTVAQDTLETLPLFRHNFHNVNEALQQFKTCVSANTSSETSCSYEVSVAIEMPTVTVASEESVDGDQTVADHTDSSTTYLAPTRYRHSSTGGSGSTYVRGYTRANGTQVRGYTRGSGRASGFGSSRSGGSSS